MLLLQTSKSCCKQKLKTSARAAIGRDWHELYLQAEVKVFCTHCTAELLSISANFCYSCGKELNVKVDEPKSEMSDNSSAVSANDLITEMFHRSYRHDVIVHLLEKNGYKMYLKRRLIDLGLKSGKKMAESQIELLNRREIEGTGRLAGYRNIWHALRLRHHVHVPRSLVARLMKKNRSRWRARQKRQTFDETKLSISRTKFLLACRR